MKPQSHLTRRLFRALIANQPYHAATCPLRVVAARRAAIPSTASAAQRRGLFGLTIGSSVARELTGQKATPRNVENALIKLSEFISAKRSRSRPPSNRELADALKFLVSSKIEQHRTMTRNEVYLVTEALKYLVDEGMVLNNDLPKALKHEDLRDILKALVLLQCKEEHRSDSVELADLISELVLGQLATLEPSDKDLFRSLYLSVLASSGAATKALALFDQYQLPANAEHPDTTLDEETYSARDIAAHALLSGLYAEGSKKDFWEVVRRCLHEDETSANFVIRHLCMRNDPLSAQQLWTTRNYWKINKPISPETTAFLLRSLARAGTTNASDTLPNDLAEFVDVPSVAGAILLWHAAQGMSSGHLLQLAQRYAENGADISMTEVNPLVEYAYSKRNPILAQHYVQVAQSVGAVPDAQTFAYKLDYELSSGDLFAAQSSFESLSIQDVPHERVDIPILNRYITKLASATDPDLQLVRRVVDRITETDGSLNADSLAALSSIFLQRRELDEAMNVLRYRIEYLPSKERAKIAQVFKDFIVDLNIKDQRAFDAYELFRAAFPETPPPQRLIIMESFFDRNRSDLACLVFGHMRQRQEVENRPNDEAYARCFYGIASCRDVDGLQMVYNMLKMDIHVEQTTKVHNAMMAAYTACQTPFTAIIDHYWKILDSREGPTLSTFKLALRACESWIGAGGEEARRIMALMQKWDLIVTKDVYDCYIGALAGQSQFENTIELIERMQEDIGDAPDATTIGTFYNAIPWQYRKDEVEAWAKKIYPELWEELVSFGDEIDEEWEVRYFNVDRDIQIDDELLFSQGQYTPILAEQARLGLPAPANAAVDEPRP